MLEAVTGSTAEELVTQVALQAGLSDTALLPGDQNEMPDPNATMLVVKVKVDGQMVVDDNGKETTIMPADLLRTIRPRIEGMKAGSEKVVFVDFEDAVPWGEVITTMDTIRSLATDENHDEIKVALKIKEDKPAGL